MSYIFDISLAFILIFSSCCFVFGWGNIINKKFNINLNCESENIIIGLFFVGSLALVLNFFSSINFTISYIIFLTGILFLIEKKDIFFKNIKIIFIISLIATVSILYSKIYLPDGAHYHLPYISILNESKIIIGLNNINLRYGQTSILQYISSIFNFGIFEAKGITVPPVLIFSCLIYFFLNQFFKNKNQNLKILSLLILIIFLVDMNRYSEFGNDEPAHMIFFYLNFLIIKNLLENKNIKNLQIDYKKIFYLALFLFMIKITYALVFFTLIFLFFISKEKKGIFNSFNIILIVIFVCWIIKNFLITSCFIYPIEITCISSEWNNYGYLSENVLTEAWSKGFPDQSKITNLNEYKNNFAIWFSTWSKNHLLVILEKLLPIILLFFLSYFLIYRTKTKNERLKISYFNFFLSINFTYVLIWLLFFPVYRFGSGYILFFLVLVFFPFFFNKKILSFKKINFLIILLCIAVIGKNINRILKNHSLDQYQTANLSSLPKIKIENQKSIKHASGLFHSTSPSYCYFQKNICTSWSLKDIGEIEVMNKYNYTIINFRNNKNWWQERYGTN